MAPGMMAMVSLLVLYIVLMDYWTVPRRAEKWCSVVPYITGMAYSLGSYTKELETLVVRHTMISVCWMTACLVVPYRKGKGVPYKTEGEYLMVPCKKEKEVLVVRYKRAKESSMAPYTMVKSSLVVSRRTVVGSSAAC